MFNETNVALSGFAGRLDTSDVKPGQYSILLEYKDMRTGQRYIAVSDKKITNPGTVC